jgi:endonuclease/exonuclease/phosphatase family metal-dependent hydrolase
MTFRRPLTTALTIAALALAACGDDDEEGFVYQDDGRLQVMTRNLYLGADIAPLFEPGIDTSTFLARANAALGAVLDPDLSPNHFSRRVGALADEIAAFRPDLVGLQEATLWRTQVPGDGPATPAPLILQDFLSTLLAELVARGVPYNVAQEIDLFDVEVPVPLTTTTVQDFRLTDRQVILAIRGLPTSNPDSGEFAIRLPVTVPDPQGGTTTVNVTRGWTKVDATVGGQRVAFYNTHLEAFSPAAAAGQAIELRTILDADSLATTAQVLVGDLNSDPADASPDSDAYNVFLGAGFDDLVATVTSVADTCCLGGPGGPFPHVLTNPDPSLESRIDHILFRGAAGRLTPVSADRIGESAADFAKSGRWPSDHAGVVGTFRP